MVYYNIITHEIIPLGGRGHIPHIPRPPEKSYGTEKPENILRLSEIVCGNLQQDGLHGEAALPETGETR